MVCVAGSVDGFGISAGWMWSMILDLSWLGNSIYARLPILLGPDFGAIYCWTMCLLSPARPDVEMGRTLLSIASSCRCWVRMGRMVEDGIDRWVLNSGHGCYAWIAAWIWAGRHLQVGAGSAEEIAGRSVEWAMPRLTVSSLAWDRWAAMEVPDGDADLGELKKKERVSTRNGCCPPWLPFGEDGALDFWCSGGAPN
ncbi:hypothetical protein ACLOJK_007768 [Asimina triloba]